MDRFHFRTQILIGGEPLSRLLAGFRRVFIVTDQFLRESGRVGYITGRLTAPGAEYQIFSEVKPDPDVDTVTAGVGQILAFAPDAVVALGGGSPIDAAKAIVYFARRQGGMEKCAFIAIPTTSGTGSEVSRFAVITDKQKGVKYPLVDDSLLPDYAVLDAELTRSVPPKVTADTGMDVLTHAVEAYVSKETGDFSEALAEKAVKLVDRYLLAAYQNPDDLEARQGMHHASCMAGAAFSNSGLGLCHGMAHALGGQAHIAHGRANAILLPYVMTFNAGCDNTLTKTAGRYAELASLIGMGATSTRQSALNLIHMVRRLNRSMGIPASIRDAGISREQFEEMLPVLSEAALADRCTASNPKLVTREEITAIYRQAFLKTTRPVRTE